MLLLKLGAVLLVGGGCASLVCLATVLFQYLPMNPTPSNAEVDRWWSARLCGLFGLIAASGFTMFFVGAIQWAIQ